MGGGDFDGGWVGKKLGGGRDWKIRRAWKPGKLRGVRDWKSKNSLKTWNLEK